MFLLILINASWLNVMHRKKRIWNKSTNLRITLPFFKRDCQFTGWNRLHSSPLSTKTAFYYKYCNHRVISHDRANFTILNIIVLLVNMAKLRSDLWFAGEDLLLFKERWKEKENPRNPWKLLAFWFYRHHNLMRIISPQWAINSDFSIGLSSAFLLRSF